MAMGLFGSTMKRVTTAARQAAATIVVLGLKNRSTCLGLVSEMMKNTREDAGEAKS